MKMNEKKKYELYEKLMLLSLKNPNEICHICMNVIISMSKISNKSEEEFEEILSDMKKAYNELDDIEKIIMKILLNKVMDL